MTSLKNIQTDLAPQAIGPYSQAVLSNGFLFVSGQLPINPATGQIVDGDATRQTEQVLANLEAVLKAAGSSLQQVVKADVFLLDLNDFNAMNDVYAKRFTAPIKPARTTVQVARLPRDARVEIACIAIV
jgi:2-iminobutanoate/2-iminopropanoate deaminase